MEAYAEKKPWVKYGENEQTLTFYYTDKGELGESEFELNSGYERPGWLDKSAEITKAVFDKSFADARPTTCYDWFYYCNKLKTIEGIENLNTSNVTNMCCMFFHYAGTSLDLSNFDTSKVTDMGLMFAFSNLTSLDLYNFDTSKVTDMGGMFVECENLTYLDLSNFDTSNVTIMDQVFSRCNRLKEVDISGFNTTNVTDMNRLFKNCFSLTTVYASDKFVTNNVGDSKEMFIGCTNLKGDISCDGENNIDMTYAKINGGYFTDAAKYAIPWAKYVGGKLTFRHSVKREFEEGKEFKLNAGNAAPDWTGTSLAPNITKVVFTWCFANARPTTCYGWFNGFKNLETIKGIEYLNTSEVTDMSGMFRNCSSLVSLDMSNFNAEKVTNMPDMFRGCSSLKSLNLTSFNTLKVINMNYMFKDCSQLKNIYVSETFSVENVSAWDAFGNCRAYLCCQPNQYAAVRASIKEYSTFNKKIRPYVSINANAPFGTLCVPFGSTLTEGSYSGFDKLYRVKDADADKCTITLEEVTTIEPGVAYIYRRDLPEDAAESIITFTADDTKTSVTAPQNSGNLLKGTFQRTYAPKGCYILLTDGNFHPVAAANSNPVGAYRAYLDLSQTTSSAASTAQTYRMVFVDGEVTGIGGISDNGANDQTDQQPKAIYDLSGRRVNAPQKGGIYIVNGKKIMYK